MLAIRQLAPPCQQTLLSVPGRPGKSGRNDGRASGQCAVLRRLSDHRRIRPGDRPVHHPLQGGLLPRFLPFHDSVPQLRFAAGDVLSSFRAGVGWSSPGGHGGGLGLRVSASTLATRRRRDCAGRPLADFRRHSGSISTLRFDVQFKEEFEVAAADAGWFAPQTWIHWMVRWGIVTSYMLMSVSGENWRAS